MSGENFVNLWISCSVKAKTVKGRKALPELFDFFLGKEGGAAWGACGEGVKILTC